ncbi:hypothetical protein JavanS54_0002 [Streptococcus satellite phage Javan54]|uniref:hypothetical protein n=1 Tax=Streptococcus agalactiae TaxID=1311 RepID=UPI000332DB6B|nr:hypothetical protein [Streptococcus agalactiae]QBX11059.1 hypothetical protein JavanS54_0002 [Streptococcus satellite phage Javan54]CCW41042.1 hypothetical protein MSA_21880 [Streptococcus agalactiae ILRI005]
MATKSFTTDLSFNRKSADSLISALSEKRNINRSKAVKADELHNLKDIKLMFAKG